MTRLTDLELLVQVAELGSLTAAARALDWSSAAASAAVKRMEESFGVALFVRSTRTLRLSPEGERLLPHVREALDAMMNARASVTSQRTTLRGILRVTMPSDLGRNVMLPWLEAFQQRHSQLNLQLHLSDQNADLMRSPMDLAIRYGPVTHSTQVAMPLAPHNRRILVASPDYVKRQGMPATAAEIQGRETLRFMLGGEVPSVWRLQVEGRWIEVPVRGKHASNDGEVVKRWALAGLGIAYKSWLDVSAEVAAGRLVHVNPHWIGEPSPLHLVVSGRRHLTPAARSLREWLTDRIAALSIAMPMP